MSEGIRRRSPVSFDVEPLERAARGGFSVTLAYGDEGRGPWLVDLSHRRAWDAQDRDASALRPMGVEVPAEPGAVVWADPLLVCRMNPTQASLWHLGDGPEPEPAAGAAITEVTDGLCLLAVVGEAAAEVMEHVTELDLFSPDREAPHLTQGPVLQIPCQVVTLDAGCLVLACSRGWGQSFAEAMLRSASPAGLRPGGERIFTRWLASW